MIDMPFAFGALSNSDDDIYPVTRITTGAVGEPGRRLFILQAHVGDEPFSWVVEKDQVRALGRAIPELLADVRREFPELGDPLIAATPNLELSVPFEPIFRVGSLGVSYDRLHDMVVLTLVDAEALRDDLEQDADAETGQNIHLTRGQAFLLSQQTERVVAAGRPICPACGEPINDFGHFCLPLQRRAGEYLQ
ncbi:MAG: hypothetical protein BWY52_00585 [Chloroflexi bacterium ADurb.Bin325]|nr:MAG: hypothetical protein BWY52_00585 [Chloroflexi bacterium ADurb.Bin325]